MSNDGSLSIALVTDDELRAALAPAESIKDIIWNQLQDEKNDGAVAIDACNEILELIAGMSEQELVMIKKFVQIRKEAQQVMHGEN